MVDTNRTTEQTGGFNMVDTNLTIEAIAKPVLTIAKPALIVGWWVLYPGTTPQTKLAMYARPTDEQIKNTETLLGWGWEDATW
jgi:hypothetical protein